jgi:hypothetical protein
VQQLPQPGSVTGVHAHAALQKGLQALFKVEVFFFWGGQVIWGGRARGSLAMALRISTGTLTFMACEVGLLQCNVFKL